MISRTSPIIVSILLVTFLLSGNCLGQELDSLRKEIDKEISDSTRLKIYLRLSNAYDGINIDSTFYFGKEALKLSQKIDDKSGIGLSNFALGNGYLSKGNLDSAEFFFLESLKSFRTQQNEEAISNVMYNLGLLNEYRGLYDSALTYYQKDLAYQIDQRDTLRIADCYLNFGAVYSNTGKTALERVYH